NGAAGSKRIGRKAGGGRTKGASLHLQEFPPFAIQGRLDRHCLASLARELLGAGSSPLPQSVGMRQLGPMGDRNRSDARGAHSQWCVKRPRSVHGTEAVARSLLAGCRSRVAEQEI